MSNLIDLESDDALDKLIAARGVVAAHFWADWCKPCVALNKLFEELSKKYAGASFVKIEAEKIPETSEKHGITVVPTFLFWKNGAAAGKIEGAKAAEVSQTLAKLAGSGASSAPAPAAAASTAAPAATAAGGLTPELRNRLEKLVDYAPVMLFMKGTPAAPQCGFSRQAVELLGRTNARFSSFNILEHPDVRNGLKEFSNWPTFPQLYIKGKLVGGLDVMKELEAEGELKDMIPAEAFQPEAPAGGDDLETRIKALISQKPVMLFMKGTPEAPRCGFSGSMVSLLNNNNVIYGSFDILSDQRVRDGLKEYSNWPTYPQVYVSGKLLGGLDVIREMVEDGSFADVIPKDSLKK